MNPRSLNPDVITGLVVLDNKIRTGTKVSGTCIGLASALLVLGRVERTVSMLTPVLSRWQWENRHGNRLPESR